MRNFTLLLLLLLFCFIASAQNPEEPNPDRLILKSGYDVRCRILSVGDYDFHIQITEEDGTVRTVDYPKKHVTSFLYGEQTEKIPFYPDRKINESSGAFRFRINTGYSIRLGKLEDQKISNFRSGFILGISPGFVLRNGKSELGIVADYRRHGYDYDDPTFDKRIGVNTFFVGPAFTGLYPSRNQKTYTGFELAIGYTHFNEKFRANKYDADALGIKTSFIYGFPIGHTGEEKMEFRVTLFASSYDKAKMNGVDIKYEESNNISSINFTLGIIFGK